MAFTGTRRFTSTSAGYVLINLLEGLELDCLPLSAALSIFLMQTLDGGLPPLLKLRFAAFGGQLSPKTRLSLRVLATSALQEAEGLGGRSIDKNAV
jgi:hypothetical protein